VAVGELLRRELLEYLELPHLPLLVVQVALEVAVEVREHLPTVLAVLEA
jgi:hypothetical protein